MLNSVLLDANHFQTQTGVGEEPPSMERVEQSTAADVIWNYFYETGHVGVYLLYCQLAGATCPTAGQAGEAGNRLGW